MILQRMIAHNRLEKLSPPPSHHFQTYQALACLLGLEVELILWSIDLFLVMIGNLYIVFLVTIIAIFDH